MVFSSHLFVFYFLPLTLLVYYGLPRRAKNTGLMLVSYVFYGWAEPWFALLMMGSTGVDYVCGRVIAAGSTSALTKGTPRTRSQRRALFVSIASNLALLGFFKYFNFGIDSFNAAAQALGAESMRWDTFLRVTLPLGISFYTFQSMSYSIDVYRGDAAVIRRPGDFACYVSMFPQLVAGPIVRFHEVARQLEERTHTVQKFARGVAFFSLGMGKKILLANPCGQLADMTFDAGSVQVLDAWYGAVAYSFQIYFDFSGYSDMAIGLGLMLGFVFPRNFDRPYCSRSITEFWQRWHISLSRWLRDYLYIPLGGNRRGAGRTYVNLCMVMLLGGLWHGANWTFVIWGAWHAALLIGERFCSQRGLGIGLPDAARLGGTYLAILASWVLFRSPDLPSAMHYFGSMFGWSTPQAGADLMGGLLYQPYYLASFGACALVVWFCRDTWEYTRRIPPAKAVFCAAVLCLSLMAMTTQAYNPFIYFIF